MDKTELIKNLSERKNGSYITINYKGELPLTAAAKKAGVTAVKETRATIRKGINYAHQKVVKEKFAAEGKTAVDALPWGNWAKGYEGLLIEHKDKTYLRMYTSKKNPSHTTYILNNKEVSYSDLQKSGYIQNSFFNKPKEAPTALTLNIDNIISINPKGPVRKKKAVSKSKITDKVEGKVSIK